MASEKQIAANRRNSRKSTGPRTARGKARSSKNALRRGLSPKDLIPGEDFRDYKALFSTLHAELQPVGAMEEWLVNRIADLTWRLERNTFLENALLAAAAKDAPPEPEHSEPADAEAAVQREEQRYAVAFARQLPALINLEKRRNAMLKMRTQAYKELERWRKDGCRDLFPEKRTPHDDPSVLAFRA